METLSGQKRTYSSSQRLAEISDVTTDVTVSEQLPLSDRLRKLMRGIPHSVVVVTSTALSSDHRTHPAYKGMTVSSFTTLSMEPSPIITFNIRQPSQTLTAISKSKQFLIHILSATESGARIADAFTKGNTIGSDLFRNPAFLVLNTWRKDGTDHSLDPPLLAAQGITKVLKCELLEEKGLIEVGDHVLVLGKVLSIIRPPTEHNAYMRKPLGLCYAHGAYRAAGTVIEVPENETTNKSNARPRPPGSRN